MNGSGRRISLGRGGSSHQDLGLLLLRVAVGASLFLKHGWEKLSGFSRMAQHFPDPVHIGPVPSLTIALAGDAICSLLVILGFFTRPAAFFAACNIAVAWSMVHHFEFFGHGAGADHGELCALYIAVFLALTIAGPGRYSLDRG
jgi:putative oxidoreductase